MAKPLWIWKVSNLFNEILICFCPSHNTLSAFFVQMWWSWMTSSNKLPVDKVAPAIMVVSTHAHNDLLYVDFLSYSLLLFETKRRREKKCSKFPKLSSVFCLLSPAHIQLCCAYSKNHCNIFRSLKENLPSKKFTLCLLSLALFLNFSFLLNVVVLATFIQYSI